MKAGKYPMPERVWYYRKGSGAYRVPESTLKAMLAFGEVAPTTPVMAEGHVGWALAQDAFPSVARNLTSNEELPSIYYREEDKGFWFKTGCSVVVGIVLFWNDPLGGIVAVVVLTLLLGIAWLMLQGHQLARRVQVVDDQIIIDDPDPEVRIRLADLKTIRLCCRDIDEGYHRFIEFEHRYGIVQTARLAGIEQLISLLAARYPEIHVEREPHW
jgi:hypothetical protein